MAGQGDVAPPLNLVNLVRFLRPDHDQADG